MAESFHDSVTGQRFQELLRSEIESDSGEDAYDRISPTLAYCKQCVALAQTGEAELALERIERIQPDALRSGLAPTVRHIVGAFVAAANAYCHYSVGDYAAATSLTKHARACGILAGRECPSMLLHGAQMSHNLVRILRRRGEPAQTLHLAGQALMSEVVGAVFGRSTAWTALADTFLVQVSSEYLRHPLATWPHATPSLRKSRERAAEMAAMLPTWELTFGRWWDFRQAVASRAVGDALAALQSLLHEQRLLTAGFAADALNRYAELASTPRSAASH